MTNLFFIALLPPKEIREKIMLIQHEVAARFGSSHALKSPPHITLIAPFKCNSEFEQLIVEPLQEFFCYSSPFDIQLRNFNRFERNRVVFIEVTSNEMLETF